MTPLQAMKQALEAMTYSEGGWATFNPIINNLRTAIAEMEKAEPVARFEHRRLTPTGTAEFFGYVETDSLGYMYDFPEGTKLYTHPQQTTPEEQLLAAQLSNKQLREALEIAVDHLLVHWSQEEMDITCPLNWITPALSATNNTAEIDALVRDAERFRRLDYEAMLEAAPKI